MSTNIWQKTCLILSIFVWNLSKMYQDLNKKLSKAYQKLIRNLSKTCQKFVKNLSKILIKKLWKARLIFVKNWSEIYQKFVKSWSKNWSEIYLKFVKKLFKICQNLSKICKKNEQFKWLRYCKKANPSTCSIKNDHIIYQLNYFKPKNSFTIFLLKIFVYQTSKEKKNSLRKKKLRNKLRNRRHINIAHLVGFIFEFFLTFFLNNFLI